MAGNKTWHVFRFQHSQGILIKTGKRREIDLRLRHLIPYCASLHKQNKRMTNALWKEGRRKQLVGSAQQGEKGVKGVASAHICQVCLWTKEKNVNIHSLFSFGRSSATSYTFSWKDSSTDRKPWIVLCPQTGFHTTKAEFPSQEISRCIFWSKSMRKPTAAFWPGLRNQSYLM